MTQEEIDALYAENAQQARDMEDVEFSEEDFIDVEVVTHADRLPRDDA